jgi:hypothetical protein
MLNDRSRPVVQGILLQVLGPAQRIKSIHAGEFCSRTLSQKLPNLCETLTAGQ